ncbi:MAG: tetratricopeptide repeat protein, partial [Chloroflexota bacterium]|nr:tetratricopeptide repeat protein [Chloroflexota bacterium]
MILDNVDDRSLIEDYRPQLGQGHLLVTTQDSRAFINSSDIRTIEVERLRREDGIRYLLYCAGAGKETNTEVTDREQEVAANIVEELDYLPLAIDQAASYIYETQCGMETYLRLFQRHRKKLLESRGRLTSQHLASVVTTISLACEKIMSTQCALDLLTFCAFVHSEDIPEEFFMQGTPEHDPLFPPTDDGQFLLAEALKSLLKYSLVRCHPTITTISIHRLVQVVLREQLESDERQRWAERVVQVVSWVEWPLESTEWLRYQRYIVHAQICASWIEQWSIESEEAARLLESAGHYLHERAQYNEAESLYMRVLTIRDHIWNSRDPAIAESHYNLGIIYLDQGKFLDAELHLRHAIALFEATHGLLTPWTAVVLRTLGELYYIQGKYAEAEKYFHLALKICMLTLRGGEDLQIASTLYCLARVYMAQGEYAEAQHLLQQSLKIREQLSSDNQALVAESLNGLATLYTLQGSHEEAKPLFQRALTIQEQVFGPEHPNVAESLNGLALLYYSQRQYTEAEPLFKR